MKRILRLCVGAKDFNWSRQSSWNRNWSRRIVECEAGEERRCYSFYHNSTVWAGNWSTGGDRSRSDTMDPRTDLAEELI